jgi:hypothetical protein
MVLGVEDEAADTRPQRIARALRRLASSVQWRRPRVRVLEIESSTIQVPEACACCGALAADTSREARPSDGVALIVPYCSECLWHVSSSATRAMALGLSSGLFALTLSAALPLVWTLPSLATYAALVLAGALLPLLVAVVVRPPPPVGHSARGRAVWFGSDGRLVCTSAPWADALARVNRIRSRVARIAEPTATRWGLAGPAIALLAIPLFYPLHFPTVRIVNLSESALTIECDGRQIATLPPTSQESPNAGLVVRLPVGGRHLGATSPDGRVATESRVLVESRATHLYAPASARYCFWLESTTYGRTAGASGQPTRTVVPLAGAARFWAFPEPIDTWFSPNPTTTPDSRSTGGRLVALRQARCLEAPAVVRQSGGP